MRFSIFSHAMRSRLAITATVAALGQAWTGLAVTPTSTFSYTTQFDATFNSTLTAPIVGTGALSYDAVSALPDGVYDWSSFTALDILLDFSFISFTEADLDTSAASVNIYLQGSHFFFGNDNGGGDGFAGGSADFGNNFGTLTTEPYGPGGPGFGGGISSPLYFMSTDGGTISGTYGVGIVSEVPESSTYAAGAAILLVLGGTCWQARRQRN